MTFTLISNFLTKDPKHFTFFPPIPPSSVPVFAQVGRWNVPLLPISFVDCFGLLTDGAVSSLTFSPFGRLFFRFYFLKSYSRLFPHPIQSPHNPPTDTSGVGIPSASRSQPLLAPPPLHLFPRAINCLRPSYSPPAPPPSLYLPHFLVRNRPKRHRWES